MAAEWYHSSVPVEFSKSHYSEHLGGWLDGIVSLWLVWLRSPWHSVLSLCLKNIFARNRLQVLFWVFHVAVCQKSENVIVFAHSLLIWGKVAQWKMHFIILFVILLIPLPKKDVYFIYFWIVFILYLWLGFYSHRFVLPFIFGFRAFLDGIVYYVYSMWNLFRDNLVSIVYLVVRV